MKGKIELLGMEFFARHGCLEKERLEGNLFVVDFECGFDPTTASQSDNLDDTVDYSAIYNIVKREMDTSSDLLEHVAGRILRAVKDACPGIVRPKVSIAKKNPPVDGPVQWSRITIEDES